MKYLIVVPSFDGGMSIHSVPDDATLLKMITPDADGYTYFGDNIHYMRDDQVPSHFSEDEMFGKHPQKGENMVVLIVEVKRVVVPKPKEVVVSYEL